LLLLLACYDCRYIGVRIVNTSDGSLVDEVALADALKQGQVQAAALDIYNAEPFYRANST